MRVFPLQALLDDLRNWKADVISLNDTSDREKGDYEVRDVFPVSHAGLSPPPHTLNNDGNRTTLVQAGADEGFTADTEFELPKWMGYGAVYIISAVPIFIGLGVVWILWTTSLRG